MVVDIIVLTFTCVDRVVAMNLKLTTKDSFECKKTPCKCIEVDEAFRAMFKFTTFVWIKFKIQFNSNYTIN